MGNVLAVSRFSPSAGLWVDINGASVTITGSMEMYGDEATAARAKLAQDSINQTWTRTFPDGYSVRANITVTYRGPSSRAGNATQIEACKMTPPSHLRRAWGGWKLNLNLNEADAFTFAVPHEFGHIIGLKDRYSESFGSKTTGLAFGDSWRTIATEAGYALNIMASSSGVVESKNVRDIAAENNPSSWWVKADDRVRDWITNHGGTDIAQLGTDAKLKCIKTLMSGFISGGDMVAIKKIMANVRDKKEADAIRKGIDPRGFASTVQRVEFHVATTQMP